MSSAQPPTSAENLVQQLAQQFASTMTAVLTVVDSAVVDITRVVYVSLVMLGLLLYYSHAERRLGKDLIKGGIVLAVVSEFVFPWLSKI